MSIEERFHLLCMQARKVVREKEKSCLSVCPTYLPDHGGRVCVHHSYPQTKSHQRKAHLTGLVVTCSQLSEALLYSSIVVCFGYSNTRSTTLFAQTDSSKQQYYYYCSQAALIYLFKPVPANKQKPPAPNKPFCFMVSNP